MGKCKSNDLILEGNELIDLLKAQPYNASMKDYLHMEV